jgi:hypothetical protein
MSATTRKFKICGARPSKGNSDGIEWDYTEVYVEQHLDPSTGMGVATVPFKFGKSDNYRHVFEGRVALPAIADVDVLEVTNGRGASKTVITAVRFAPQQKPQATA